MNSDVPQRLEREFGSGMLYLMRGKSLDEEGRAYMGNALLTAVYALLSWPSRLSFCCEVTLRFLLATTGTNDEEQIIRELFNARIEIHYSINEPITRAV
jgi:hypothetical protein